MIVIEKIRAICQSMDQYKEIVTTARQKKRARDIYDICNLFDKFPNIGSEITEELIINIFQAKQVPIDFIDKIIDIKERYREDWESVKATIFDGENLESYDFYFEKFSKIIKDIKDLLDK